MPLFEQVRHIYPGMFLTRKEQGDLAVLYDGYHAGGKHPCSRGFFIDLFYQLQDLHGGIVVMDDIALGGLTDQFPIGGVSAPVGGILYYIPLG